LAKSARSLDFAKIRMRFHLAGGGPNDCFKYGMQCGSLYGFLDDTLDLLVGNLGEVGFLASDGASNSTGFATPSATC